MHKESGIWKSLTCISHIWKSLTSNGLSGITYLEIAYLHIAYLEIAWQKIAFPDIACIKFSYLQRVPMNMLSPDSAKRYSLRGGIAC
jgi:hypothetical protein